MPILLEILAALGVSTAARAAIVALITRLGGGVIFRSAFVRRRLLGWAIGIYELADNAHWLYNSVCKYLSKLTGEVIDSLDFDAILHAGGRAFAKTFRKKLLEKYGIDCPITDWASETIAEEVGQWFADMINQKIQELAHTDQVVFSTMFPTNNIVPELDAFLTEELSVKLDIHVTSVLQNSTLLDDIKTQVIEKIMTEFYTQMEQVKLNAIAEIKDEFFGMYGTGYTEAIGALENVMPTITELMDADIKKRIPIFNQVKFTPNRKKIANRLRQKKYRETHREVRHWELK